jgi:tetratricopeptide (TPR) repeat protein
MDMCRHLLDPSDNWIKMTMQNMAYVYDQLGDKDECARLLLKSQVNKEVDILSRFMTNERRACEYMQNGDFQYAISLYEEFLHSTESIKEGAALYRARALGNMALCYEHLKQYDQAFEYHKKSAAVADTVTSEDIDTITPVYRNLGITYYNRKQYEECIEPLKKYIELKKRPKAKPAQEKVKDCWQYLWSAYDILTSQCRGKAAYDEAMQWAECMLDVCRQGLGTDTPEMGGAYSQIALICEGKGFINEALQYYQQAIDKYTPFANRFPIRLYDLNRFMAELYERQGQPAEAVNHYAEAIRYLEQQDNTVDLPLMYNQLGMVYGRNEKYKESLPYLVRALELAKKEYNDNAYDSRLYPLYFNVGYTFEKLGEMKKAQQYFDFAESIKNQ